MVLPVPDETKMKNKPRRNPQIDPWNPLSAPILPQTPKPAAAGEKQSGAGGGGPKNQESCPQRTRVRLAHSPQIGHGSNVEKHVGLEDAFLKGVLFFSSIIGELFV